MYYIQPENKNACLVNGETILPIGKINLKELKDLEIHS